MSKTKIRYIEGCNYSLTINEIEFADLSIDSQKAILHRVIDNSNAALLQRYLEDFTTLYGEEDEPYKCEQCGEYNYEYTVEI